MSAPTHKQVRQHVLNGEIGGEMHDAVLLGRIQRVHDMTPIEAASAVHDAHVAGYLKPGFWDPKNWGPAYPERER